MKTFTKNKTPLLFSLLVLSFTSLQAQTIKSPTDSTTNSIDTTKYTNVEYKAEFQNGGLQAWAQYISRNIDADVPTRKKAPVGSYKVIIRFIIDRDGKPTNIEAETSFGYGMEEEAIRVINNSPLWIPAFQNGKNVSSYIRQPIVFTVSQ
ncbi:MAG TPA: energy transducer TonB [Ferruginibacter sp.]|nr:energy transducer TonB [Ferruginibacter sp.]